MTRERGVTAVTQADRGRGNGSRTPHQHVGKRCHPSRGRGVGTSEATQAAFIPEPFQRELLKTKARRRLHPACPECRRLLVISLLLVHPSFPPYFRAHLLLHPYNDRLLSPFLATSQSLGFLITLFFLVLSSRLSNIFVGFFLSFLHAACRNAV